MKDLIEKVLAADAAATKGPWRVSAGGAVVQTAHITRDVWFIPRSMEDVELIALYRDAAPALAREVERLRALLGEARTAVLTCAQIWPDGVSGEHVRDLLARIDAAIGGAR